MIRPTLGMASFRELLTNGHAQVVGPSRLARAFPTWFDTSMFSASLGRARRHQAEAAASA